MNAVHCICVWLVALSLPSGVPDVDAQLPTPRLPSEKEKARPPARKAGSETSASQDEGPVAKFRKDRPDKVVVVKIEGALDRKAAQRLKRQTALLNKDAVLIVAVNSSGGTAAAAQMMSDVLLAAKARTVAFVNKRALGHAALVPLSCTLVAMAPGARWGALEVNQFSGAGALSAPSVRELSTVYGRAAEKTGKQKTVAVTMVDAAATVELPKNLLKNTGPGEREGLAGAKKGKFLWVGPATARALKLSHLKVLSVDGLRSSLGLGSMDAEIDGKIHAALIKKTVYGDGLRVPRAKPVDIDTLLKGITVVHVLKIEGTIDLGLAPFVVRVIKGLKPSDLAVLDIDTFGGRVDGAVRIRDALLKTKAKTIAFINRRAISAGALISLACDLIVMTSGGSIGAATPVQISGGKMKATSEKVVSYMRKEMKSTAEAKGRRGDLAEAMVDRDTDVKDLPEELREKISGLKKGKLLTLTTKEAMQLGMADLEAETFDEMMDKLKLKGLPVRRPTINWAERIARFLTDPFISGLLMTIGLLGIVLELYTPTFGIAGIIGLVCLILFFFGHMVVDLAGWGHVILFGAGVILLGVEIFVTPGFGLLGMGGVGLILISLILSLMGAKDIGYELAWDLGYVTRALAVVLGSVAATAVLTIVAVRYLPKTSFLRSLVLQVEKGPADGADGGGGSTGQSDISVGDRGVSVSVLRPAGRVKFRKLTVSAVAQGKSIPTGTEVEVVRKELGRVVVKKV